MEIKGVVEDIETQTFKRRKHKKMKKKGIMCVAAMLLGTVLFSTPVLAKNAGDTEYSFYLGMSAEYIKPRLKQDASSTYIYCQPANIPGSFVLVAVMGSDSTSDYGTNVTAKVANARYEGGQRFIKQYVYERGYTYARLRFNRGDASGDIKGVWSPDSVGSYPSLN